MLSQRSWCLLKMLLATMCWGGAFVVARMIAPYAGPATLALLRFALASCVLILMVWHAGECKALTLKTFGFAVFSGLTGILGYNIFFFWALQTTSASRASLIINTNAVFIALLAIVFFGERLALSRLTGIFLATCGAFVLLSRGEPFVLFEQGFSQGDKLMLGCIAAWAAYTFISKKALPYFTPLSLTMWACCMGTLFLLPVAIAEGFPSTLLQLPAKVWWASCFLAFFATALAFKWYCEGLQILGVARTAVFINVVPISAVVLSVLLLDEHLAWSSVLGGCMTISGTWLTNRV